MKKYLLFLIGLFLLLPVMAQTDEGSDDAEIVEASDESLSDIDNKVVLHRYKMGDGLRFTTQGGNKLTVSGMAVALKMWIRCTTVFVCVVPVYVLMEVSITINCVSGWDSTW